jgi:hypothetical protein
MIHKIIQWSIIAYLKYYWGRHYLVLTTEQRSMTVIGAEVAKAGE